MASTPHILICDDNDDILSFMYIALRDAGFEVTTVHSEREAFDALKTVSPDLFILDIFMPESDGFWLAEELQSRGFEKPIMFVTAYDSPAVRLNAPVIGAVEYMRKPVDTEVLVKKGGQALQSSPAASNWNLKVTEGLRSPSGRYTLPDVQSR